MDPEFKEKNQYTLSQSRGAGFWVWKPYIILKTMIEMKDDDWLMYTDSGMYFIKNPWEEILRHESCLGDKGVCTFGTCGINKNFCKRDTFILMSADDSMYTDSPHRTASIFVCRKTDFSVSFVKEWLHYSSDSRIITDLPNTQGKPNYPEFKDHRHDQSIMSILCAKHDVCLLDDLTQFGRPSDPFIFHTRNPL